MHLAGLTVQGGGVDRNRKVPGKITVVSLDQATRFSKIFHLVRGLNWPLTFNRAVLGEEGGRNLHTPNQ